MTDPSASPPAEAAITPDQPLQSEPDRQPAASAVSGPRRTAAWLLPLNLLVLGAGGLLGFVVLQQRAAMEQLANDTSAQLQGNAALEQRLATAESARNSLAEQVEALLADTRGSAGQADVLALQNELAGLRRSLATQSSPQRDWLVAEAASLLRLAAQQALHGSNVGSAISLYQSADELLRQAAEPALQPVRAALQLELDALRATELPAIANLYLQLGDLARQLDGLQLQSENEAPLRFEASNADALAPAAGWWEQAKQMLGAYFVVTRQDAPVLARLAPEQAFMLRQAIRLQLESARLALLQGDQRLYEAALDAALEGVTQQLQGSGKSAVLASLQRLRAQTIAVQLPPLGSALQGLELLEAAAAQASGAARQ